MVQELLVQKMLRFCPNRNKKKKYVTIFLTETADKSLNVCRPKLRSENLFHHSMVALPQKDG